MKNGATSIVTLGLGTMVLAGTWLVSEGPALGKETEYSGSTQRFRGTITAAERESVAIEKQKARIASRAKVSLEQAIKTATEKVPGSVVGAELEYKPQDMAVWELEVLSVDGKEVHMSVDAATGELLETGR